MKTKSMGRISDDFGLRKPFQPKNGIPLYYHESIGTRATTDVFKLSDETFCRMTVRRFFAQTRPDLFSLCFKEEEEKNIEYLGHGICHRGSPILFSRKLRFCRRRHKSSSSE